MTIVCFNTRNAAFCLSVFYFSSVTFKLFSIFKGIIHINILFALKKLLLCLSILFSCIINCTEGNCASRKEMSSMDIKFTLGGEKKGKV